MECRFEIIVRAEEQMQSWENYPITKYRFNFRKWDTRTHIFEAV